MEIRITKADIDAYRHQLRREIGIVADKKSDTELIEEVVRNEIENNFGDIDISLIP